MFYGICNLSIVPLRETPSDKSEMVSQVLFGEHFEVLESNNKWSKIKLHIDEYEGYIDTKQYQEISLEIFEKLSNEKPVFSGEFINFITDHQNNLTTIPIGARLPFFNEKKLSINTTFFSYEGKVFSETLPKTEIIKKALMFINSPYLWGGRTPFGIDCSGFTQMVYKLCGYALPRDAKDQVLQGEVLSFIEESEPGDLAFFDNEEGIIIHVGIVMDNYHIIHAHGKVRIDTLDHSGIFNIQKQKHTHKLRILKRIVWSNG